MTTQALRQLTPYETRIYFVPDTKAADQKKRELDALNAGIHALDAQTNSQLNGLNSQIHTLNSQISSLKAQVNNQISAALNGINTQANSQLKGLDNQIQALKNQLNSLNGQENFIKSFHLKGFVLLISNLISIGLLALTYPFLKLHALTHFDPYWCQIPYFLLLPVEAYLLVKTSEAKKKKNLYLYLFLWVGVSLIYFNYLVNSRYVVLTTDLFYLCTAFHFYSLYRGSKVTYTAIRKGRKKLGLVQQKEQELRGLQQQKDQVKEDQQRKLQNKKLQVKGEQQQKLQQKERELSGLQQKRTQVQAEQQRKLEQKKSQLKNLQQQKLQQISPPTDQEFDIWLENRVREGLISTLRRLGLEHEVANHRKMLRVRGYVLPGMRDARHYRSQDLCYKLGTDGKRRYSVNLYTYFYPADHRIMVFTYDINAMNWNDYRETMREYFYQDVIGATTEDDHDTLYIDGKPRSYRTQRFSLRLCDGTAISATVRSHPLDDIANLPVFDIPQSNIDSTISQLRLLLREKKS